MPITVPSLALSTGATIPAMGYGVYMMSSEEVREYLPQALELGYTHIDTANAYFNEVAVGEVIRGAGVAREQLFITSKLFPQSYPYDRCTADIDATLERMGLDYLDLLLLHQPYGDYVHGWRAMEEALRAGKVRAIGLSNFPIHKIAQVMEVAEIAPQVLQVEINPYWNQHALKRELASMGLGDIVFEGWYPLGHGDKALLADPVLAEIAAAHDKTTAQVALRWSIQEGNVVFPKASNLEHMRQNIDIFDFELADNEMARINALPQRPYYEVPEEPPAFVLVENDYTEQA